MEDKCELKVIALRSALDLAVTNRNVNNPGKTAERIVSDAKTMHDFLVKEDDNKNT